MNKITTTIFLVLFSFAACFGQETEAAASLNLTGTSLPSNAQRVLPDYVPVEIDRNLENWLSASKGKLVRGDTEVVLWTGRELKLAGTETIVSKLTDNLKAAGWRYEVGGEENGITLFSLLKDGTKRRAIVGLYGEADGTLLFALTELHAGPGERSNSNTTSKTSGHDGSGSVADYNFVTPNGWSRSDSANKIVLTKGGEYKIEFLPFMESSGNLERDAQVIIWQVFRDNDAWYSNGFEADYGTFEKGRTAQGLEYYRVYRYAKKIGDENNGSAPSKFDAILLLVKLGGKVAVIAGRQPFQTDYSHGTTLTAIDFILYDLAFKGATDSYDPKSDLLGSWSAASRSAAVAYTFNSNGTFQKGAASGFRTQHDSERDKVSITSYGMTQVYSLSGNVLTQNYKQSGEVVRRKIRIYYTKYDKNAWEKKLGLLPVGGTEDGKALVLTR